MMKQIKRPPIEQIYMWIAEQIAMRSKCKRAQVGTVLVTSDFQQTIGTGYNGGASKCNDKCLNVEGQCGCLHSELNCLLRSTQVNRYVKKYLFCTTLPCIMCCKAIINYGGVKKVYYKNTYRDKSSVKLFRRAKVKVIKL